MSEKKEINRSDLVRLRREQENRQRMERARKESTRSNPPVARRSRRTHRAMRSACCRSRSPTTTTSRSPRDWNAAALTGASSGPRRKLVATDAPVKFAQLQLLHVSSGQATEIPHDARSRDNPRQGR